MFEDALEAFASHGLNPGHLVPDGAIHRFKIDQRDTKKSGWYIGYQNHRFGADGVFHVFVYGNMREQETFTFKPEISKEEEKVVKPLIKRAKEIADKGREDEQKVVAEELGDEWLHLSFEGESGYLEKKRINEFKKLGVKFRGEDCVCIPMRDEHGKLWSIQSIYKIEGVYQKRYAAGGRVKGTFHAFGNLEDAETIYFAEGFATAATIFQATGKATVCAFSSGGLAEVAKIISRKYRNRKYIICGDNDKWKNPDKNPGIESAEKAAKACNGTFVVPNFGDEWSDRLPKDFNDLYVLEGIAEVTRELESLDRNVKADYVIPLGFREKEYFFTTSSNKQIISFSRLGKAELNHFMPVEYWANMYPKRGSDNGEGDSTTAFNVDQAASDLMKQCRERGIFEPMNIRGCGVWRDEKRIVINMGDHLIVDGERRDLIQLKSRYFYQLSKRFDRSLAEPATLEECRIIIDACTGFKWKRNSDGILLAGSLMLSRICGATPVRPHTWITGERGSGKTTLLQRLVRPLMGPAALNLHGATTEAGVRQKLGADAIPILFDEFETKGHDEAQQKILELLRACWSDTEAVTVKGSAGGVAAAFHARCLAIVSSIRVNLKNDADLSRFAVIELAPTNNDREHWEKLDAVLRKIDEELCARIFARMVSMVHVIVENIKVFKTILGQKADARFGDQYGTILGAYSALVKDSKMEPAEAAIIVQELDLHMEIEKSTELDQYDALAHLRDTVFEVGDHRRTIGSIITECIARANHPVSDNAAILSLQNIGIRVDSDYVSIAAKHANLEKTVFRGTHWSKQWALTLLRLEGAVRKSVRIDTETRNAVKIPVKLFVE